MKAIEQYFPVVLFIMLYKVVLTFESVDEILKCDHSNESYWAVLSCGAVYYAMWGDSDLWVWMKSKSVAIPIKGTEQYFPVQLFIMLYELILAFWVCRWLSRDGWMNQLFFYLCVKII